jgi:hypothetical protein
MNVPEDKLLRRARRRVRMKAGFGIHMSVYVLVNFGLAAINRIGGGTPWHLWPLAGWGVGLAIHGLVTLLSLRGEGLQQGWIERELQRLKRQGG